jgi:hypothetical protein
MTEGPHAPRSLLLLGSPALRCERPRRRVGRCVGSRQSDAVTIVDAIVASAKSQIGSRPRPGGPALRATLPPTLVLDSLGVTGRIDRRPLSAPSSARPQHGLMYASEDGPTVAAKLALDCARPCACRTPSVPAPRQERDGVDAGRQPPTPAGRLAGEVARRRWSGAAWRTRSSGSRSRSWGTLTSTTRTAWRSRHGQGDRS